MNAGEREEWYIEFYSNENEIHYVARDQYLEMKEFFSINEEKTEEERKKEKWINDYKNYQEWENKTRIIEQKRINALLIK